MEGGGKNVLIFPGIPLDRVGIPVLPGSGATRDTEGRTERRGMLSRAPGQPLRSLQLAMPPLGLWGHPDPSRHAPTLARHR